MSSPFVYTQSSTVQYPHQYQHTPYSYSPQPGTPFLPDLPLHYYHNSPYSHPASLPPSPRVIPASIPPAGIPFPGTPGADTLPAWSPYVRDRRPSWHASNPWLGPPPSPSGGYPVGVAYSPHHQRRHSFSAQPAVPPWSPSSAFYLNPWLNAEAPRGDFIFDLNSTTFSPMRIYGPGQAGPLSQDELVQPATHPPITRLRIVCDLIPQWPLDLQPNSYMAGAAAASPGHWQGGWSPGGTPYQLPPITLVDVLVAVHRHLHKQISHADWARLSEREEIAVGKAYTARCRAAQSTSEHELAQGVKRVDFLLGRTKMVGVVRMPPADEWEVMKLHVRQ